MLSTAIPTQLLKNQVTSSSSTPSSQITDKSIRQEQRKRQKLLKKISKISSENNYDNESSICKTSTNTELVEDSLETHRNKISTFIRNTRKIKRSTCQTTN